MVSIRLVPYRSEEWTEIVKLRFKVLREPLGLDFSPEQLEAEAGQMHLGAFLQDQLVGCLLLRPASATEIVMRQVAVCERMQGQGIGKLLMEEAESLAQTQGYSCVSMHARLSVAGFYERLGYERQGDVFEEVTLSHIKMMKWLA